MTELEAVTERHSVRNYLDKKIEPEKIEKIKAVIDECNREGDLHIQFVEYAGKTFNKLFNRFSGLGSAPSVIACVGERSDDLDERIGYFGERIVLFAQTLGLNTCWAGMFNKNNVNAEVGAREKLLMVIAIGYGKTQGNERKSKSADKVSSAEGEAPEWFGKAVSLALLAPTAINQQNFEIILDSKGAVSFIDKGGPFSGVDLGIVKYHFDLGRKLYM